MHLYDEVEFPILIHDGIFLLHANDPAVALFRFPNLPALLQHNLLEILDEVSVPLAQKRLELLRADPERQLPAVEYIFKRADGTRFLATVQTRSLGWMGDVLKLEIVFRSVVDEIVDW